LREIDYQAFRLITQRSEGGSRLKKERQLRDIEKLWKSGVMGYPESEPDEWKWRLCEGRMMLGFFEDWTGWEYRNRWAKGLWFNSDGAWQGQRTDIFVYGEQGLGDEVLFSQVVPDAKKQCQGNVTLECEPRLVSVFNRCLPVTAVPVQIEKDPNGVSLRRMGKPAVPWIPLGDLLRNFRRFPVQFPRKPWLWADPEQVERFRKYRGRTAIVWRGAQGEYPWKKIAGLVKDPISLQYDQRPDETVDRPDFDVRDDVEALMGFLANVRLLGPSNTAIHFAASMGCEVDVIIAPLNGRRKNMLPFRYYGMPDSQKSIWYPDTLTRWESLEHFIRLSRRR
jgi:hypothetical protein